ncbi:MAG: HAD family hydrolase [Acidobacteria bacterium]|nr:MAG: HAD family hydrolase [Acidobacteriota bacterium]
MYPRVLLLDLDDTILDDSGLVHECWRDACADHAERVAPLDAAVVADAIRRTSRWYWSDAERHRAGRLALDAARREVVRLALVELGIGNEPLADAIGDAYSRRREAGMEPLPDAIETVRWLRDSGRRLALLTNGAGPAQRKKILRFGLAELFDAILIEGELGFGKPDERVYHRALAALDVGPSDAWMVGDNLEWDVAAPQKLGMSGVWIDLRGRGVPQGARPDYTVRSLSDIRSLIAMPVR